MKPDTIPLKFFGLEETPLPPHHKDKGGVDENHVKSPIFSPRAFGARYIPSQRLFQRRNITEKCCIQAASALIDTPRQGNRLTHIKSKTQWYYTGAVHRKKAKRSQARHSLQNPNGMAQFRPVSECVADKASAIKGYPCNIPRLPLCNNPSPPSTGRSFDYGGLLKLTCPLWGIRELTPKFLEY